LIILVDAMGGDNAPEAIVNGCLDAVSEADGFEILLIGDEGKIREILNKRSYDTSRIKIHHASEVITVEDTPTKAIKTKKDSSMVVGFKLLKEKKGDIFLSCGNSGALMTGALFILGRTQGQASSRIKDWIASDKTYTCRFGIGMLMMHYLDKDFKPEYLELPQKVDSEEYYVKMMIAWFYATALANQWDATIPYIEEHRLSDWVHKKTIQKACESYRITDEQKAYLKTLR